MSTTQTKQSTLLSTQTHQPTKTDRFNFSRYGRLCDQDNYHHSKPVSKSPQGYQPASPKGSPKVNPTYGFSSTSRQKRGNFRFPIRLPKGQLSHHPQYFVGKEKSPRWFFSKAQKYKNQKHTDYQVCPKNYMIQQKKNPESDHTKSFQQIYKDKVRLKKSSSFLSTTSMTAPGSTVLNYSIIGGRQTSPVGFYQKSKITKPLYLNRQGLMKIEQRLEKDRQHQKQPCPKGYIEFPKKRGRQPNRNVKGFETYLYAYEQQRQFNNYSETSHPTKPNFHIDMSVHLQRKKLFKDRIGPNPQVPNIDITRPAVSNVDLNLAKFRSSVRTRYDRVEAPPNTRLDYDIPDPELGGMVTMNQTLNRQQWLWPVVDPIIKRPEDQINKQQLKKHIPVKQYNEALRPRCNQPCIPKDVDS